MELQDYRGGGIVNLMRVSAAEMHVPLILAAV